MRGIRAESCPFSRLMARDFQIIFTRFLSGERRIEMRVCTRSSLCARRNAASCELIHDARIANNRVRRAGCGLSRPVIPRVQQRDCNERANERASVCDRARARSRIARVNRVRSNNIYKRPRHVYVIDDFRVRDSFVVLCDKPETTNMSFRVTKKIHFNIGKMN